MPIRIPVPGKSWIDFRGSLAVRTGLFVGAALSLVFTMWVVIANRVPQLEQFAMQRNICTAVLLLFFAGVPVLRFYRSPNDLLVSSLIGWSLLTVTYRLLCVVFVLLDEHYSTGQVFVLGAVLYLILATLSWIGNIVWRVRTAYISHSNH